LFQSSTKQVVGQLVVVHRVLGQQVSFSRTPKYSKFVWDRKELSLSAFRSLSFPHKTSLFIFETFFNGTLLLSRDLEPEWQLLFYFIGRLKKLFAQLLRSYQKFYWMSIKQGSEISHF